MEDILKKIDALPLQRIGTDTGASLVALKKTLEATSRLAERLEREVAPEAGMTLSEARRALYACQLRRPYMPLSDNQLHFFISYAVAFLVLGLIAKWYLWPAIRDRAPKDALTPLLLYAWLRVNGLTFLMPGLVSPKLPRAFAVPTAYGDLTAAVLALLTLACVRTVNAAGAPMVWLFNIVGLLDLIYANISTFKDQVDPTYLGVSYYLAVLNVPAMVVVHVVIFAYLLKWRRPWPARG